MYTDPNGEYCLIDDLLAMGLGGVVNVVSNLVSGNIHSFGQGCAYFGIGAVSAEVSLYASPIVGGSLLGGANSALTSYIQTGSVNGQSMAMGVFMGGATSYLGSIVGGKASAWISKWTGKLASPILKSWLPQAFGGSASGFTLSTGMSLLNGESLETALKEGGKGAASGFAIGSLSGIAYGFKNAKSENVSPWTGKTRTNTDDLTPNEAAETFGITGTLDRINRGEKLPHKNDGTVYHNKGGELPEYEDGYYHEYVHPIDGQRFPGAHRVIKGNGGEIYYTPDHYHNFFRIR